MSNTSAKFAEIKAHFDCLKELEATHGDLSDASRLREVLRQCTFQLGLEAHKCKSVWTEMTILKNQKERLRDAKIKLDGMKEAVVAELT